MRFLRLDDVAVLISGAPIRFTACDFSHNTDQSECLAVEHGRAAVHISPVRAHAHSHAELLQGSGKTLYWPPRRGGSRPLRDVTL